MHEELCPGAEISSQFVVDPGSLADPSKRRFLNAAGLLMAGLLLPKAASARGPRPPAGSGHRIVVVVVGGVRRDETFSAEGMVNIPHLSQDLLPRSLFYRHARNEGVTAHFNAISSILTGNWQHVDDWGKIAPTSPTLFEQFRKGLRVDRSDTWVVASNKALTNLIGASSDTNYGPAFGANVVFPKQLMLQAVVDALHTGRTANMADRGKVEAELENAMEGSNYEGLGWNVFDASAQLDPRVRATIQSAIANFVRSGGPTSGDELTFFMSREIMRRFSPQLLVVAYSDVEAAHFGSYSLHMAGIKTADRLTYQLWQEIETNPDYKDKTTMVVLPEFGRDPDGSSTNGFFNHRANDDSTRDFSRCGLSPSPAGASEKDMMRNDEKFSVQLQQALAGGLLKRIPLTFLPFVNQQLNQWEFLFPNERQSVERLLLYVAGLTQQQSARLFQPVVELENKMGVRQWRFSTSEQTIENSSQLAASPYFQDWRRAVQAVFDSADAHARANSQSEVKLQRKLVLLGIPPNLPLDGNLAWRRWQGMGRPIKIDLGRFDPGQTAFSLLVAGSPSDRPGGLEGLLDAARSRPGAHTADSWVVDAGKSLVDTLVASPGSQTAPARAVLLSNGRLDICRQSFSREMNSMRKDLADADAVFDRLRKVDVAPWCPAEVNADPAIREFVRSLYLSGNGAVIFGNSFVQWAAAEAFRRARPTFLAAQFGVRSKPKPFTGVAVFDNPDQVNPLPAIDDLAGSAIDAHMLALYVWLAAYRFEDYQHSTVCVCLAENLHEAYLIAPAAFSLDAGSSPIPLEGLHRALHAWIA